MTSRSQIACWTKCRCVLLMSIQSTLRCCNQTWPLFKPQHSTGKVGFQCNADTNFADSDCLHATMDCTVGALEAASRVTIGSAVLMLLVAINLLDCATASVCLWALGRGKQKLERSTVH